ncbi:MAG: hypothetical protein AABW59_02845 [archaeon]
MIKGKISRPARQFVESHFGRGTAAGKITTNTTAAVMKIFKGAPGVSTGQLWSEIENMNMFIKGTHMRESNFSKKSLVYVKKSKKNLMAPSSPFYKKAPEEVMSLQAQDSLTLTHELLHRGFHNYFLRAHKRPPQILVSELVASFGALCYIRHKFGADYKKYVAEFDDFTLARESAMFEHLSSSALASALALRLHKKVPQEKLDSLLPQIASLEFKKPKDAVEWVLDRI